MTFKRRCRAYDLLRLCQGQINLQVPFEVAGSSSAQVVVTYNPASRVPRLTKFLWRLRSRRSSPFIRPQGTDPIIQNFPDYSLNKAANPIARGGVAILYAAPGSGNWLIPWQQASRAIRTAIQAYTSTRTLVLLRHGVQAQDFQRIRLLELWLRRQEATWTVGVPANSPTGAVTLTCTDSARAAVKHRRGTIYVK